MYAVVCGAGGFIGHHLVKRLKREGYWVRGIDLHRPLFEPTLADEFHTFDLRYMRTNDWLMQTPAGKEPVDEVYQLAAEVGGLGYIMDNANDAAMLYNSVQINLHIAEACRFQKVPKVLFTSSACVYPSNTERACRESDAYPAEPDNEYAWEKLFSERVYDAYRRVYDMGVRIARLHNCYGPLGTWRGGREKAPAAICRKVAEAEPGGTIEVWGDGTQRRSFMYVDDAVEGLRRLMRSDVSEPVNLGSDEMVTVNELVWAVARAAGKEIAIRHVEGPVGVQGRSSDNTLITERLGWSPVIPLSHGIKQTYRWIATQVAMTHDVDTAGETVVA